MKFVVICLTLYNIRQVETVLSNVEFTVASLSKLTLKYLGDTCSEGVGNSLHQREQRASLEIYVQSHFSAHSIGFTIRLYTQKARSLPKNNNAKICHNDSKMPPNGISSKLNNPKCKQVVLRRELM